MKEFAPTNYSAIILVFKKVNMYIGIFNSSLLESTNLPEV